MLTVEAHFFAVKHRNHDLQRLFEFLESVGKGAELVAKRIVFKLEPACADSQSCPPDET